MSAQRASYWSALNFKLLFAQANSLSVPVNSLLCQRIRYLYITVLLGCISIQHIKNLSGKSSMFRKQLQAFDVFLREGDKRWLLATAKVQCLYRLSDNVCYSRIGRYKLLAISCIFSYC